MASPQEVFGERMASAETEIKNIKEEYNRVLETLQGLSSKLDGITKTISRMSLVYPLLSVLTGFIGLLIGIRIS